MKNILVTISFLIIMVFEVGAQPKLPKVFWTVRINDSALMAQTEVSIKDWMGFIINNNFDASLFPDTACLTNTAKLVYDDLKNKAGFQYLKVAANTPGQKVRGELGVEANSQFKKLIHADTNFFSLDFPVTGITYEQAQKFCKWKQDIINSTQNKTVSVSLPSVKIYKSVIANIDTLNKNCECPMLNSSTSKNAHNEKDRNSQTQGKGLVIAVSYFPTKLGLYGLEGNAAEMTSTEGVAMGGSFRQTARESYSDRSQKYIKPEDWLGFRYVIISK